ncbi:hypothetical protein R6Q59_031700 [Mikania micrantha]
MGIQLKQLLSLTLLIAIRSLMISSQSLPSCPDKCGNVSIPYPFGTIKGCYLNKFYKVNCTTLQIWNTSFKLLDITLDGHMRGLLPVAHHCYPNHNKPSEIQVKLSRFPISDSLNLLTTVGCDARADMKTVDGKDYVTGCLSMSGCNFLANGSCLGMGCSQVPVPSKLTTFQIHTERNTDKNVGNWIYNNCTYGFLVKKDDYMFQVGDLDNMHNRSFAVDLQWSVGNTSCEEAQMNDGNYACKENSNCSSVMNEFDQGYQGYRCGCADGFDGNPYISHGCQGPFINEFYQYIATAASVMLSIVLYGGLKQRKILKSREKFFKKNGGLILQKLLFESKQKQIPQMAKIFSARALETATNNFHKTNVVGQGGYGTVYKGTLADKTMVAIKRSKSIDENQIEQFINEVIMLSGINHPNVVKLLGCCLETQTPLLVYEFVTNKTVFQHLHENEFIYSLTFERRLNIATQTAEALSHIHSTTQIIHRDIKSSNILLTDDYTAKVSDFGISRFIPVDQTHLQTLVHGTLGYIDPEYFRSGILTEKSDVYSFGMVLVELLTGRKVYSHDGSESELGLAMYFVSSLERGCLMQVLDAKVKEDGLDGNIKKVAKLAKECVELEGKKRPNMKQVKHELKDISESYIKGSFYHL